jgi:hypothetical protein
LRAVLALVAFSLTLPSGGTAGARESGDGWSFARQKLATLRQMTPKERAGRRFLLVVDIDYTVTDPRRRTQEAARLFGLGHVPLGKIGWDGRETAHNLGMDARTTTRFQRFWRQHFWKPESIHLDKAMPTAALLHEAKAAGAEIVYLTGRIDALRDATIDRLRALGLPDPEHVVTKPRVAVRTTAFKTRWLASLPPRTSVLWYMTDSPSELRSLRRGRVSVPTVFVHGPAPDARGWSPGKTPSIRVRR